MQPLPYHHAICRHFQQTEPALWKWFASTVQDAAEADRIRLELLKNTYKMDREIAARWYGLAQTAADALGVAPEITLYQAQQVEGHNAGLYYLPGEAHIVFSGAITELLSDVEMLSVLGHELAHYRLWQENLGEFRTLDRLLQRLQYDDAGRDVYQNTWWRYRQYTEVYADRGGLAAAQDLEAVISGLVKVNTGLRQVSAASYLAQAQEIAERGSVGSEEFSHPELFIRTLALHLHASGQAATETKISALIEGELTLAKLDVLGQQRCSDLTRQLLQGLLQPHWMRSDATLAHARLFFYDFESDAPVSPQPWPEWRDGELIDYWAYLLLDFVAVDPGLGDVGVAATWQWAKTLGIQPRFEELLVKETKMTKKALTKLKAEAAQLLADAASKVGHD